MHAISVFVIQHYEIHVSSHIAALIMPLILHLLYVHPCFITLKVDVEEVMYIAKELWHGRSARDLSIKDVGRAMWRSVNELMLVRYVC